MSEGSSQEDRSCARSLVQRLERREKLRGHEADTEAIHGPRTEGSRSHPRGWRISPSKFLISKPLFLCLLPPSITSASLSPLLSSDWGQQALPLLTQLPRLELAMGRKRGPNLPLALTAWGGLTQLCVHQARCSFRKKTLVPQGQEAPPRLIIPGVGYFPLAC